MNKVQHYDIGQIRTMLDRYYLGETTLEEEMALGEYFAQATNVPEEMKADAALLAGMYELDREEMTSSCAQAEAMMPDGMEERLMATIDRLDREERLMDEARGELRIGHDREAKEPPRIGLYLHRAAACVAVVLAVVVGYQTLTDDPFADTCSTPEEASVQMQRALALLNSKSRMGLEQARKSLEQPTASEKPMKTMNRYISFD